MIPLVFGRTFVAGALAAAMLTPLAAAAQSPEEATAIAKEAFIYAYPMLYGYKTLQEQTQDQFAPGYIGGFGRFRHYSEAQRPGRQGHRHPEQRHALFVGVARPARRTLGADGARGGAERQPKRAAPGREESQPRIGLRHRH